MRIISPMRIIDALRFRSDHSGAFHEVVAIDEFDPQAFRFGIDHQRARRAACDSPKGVASGLLAEVGACDLQSSVVSAKRLLDQLAHDALEQAAVMTR